MNTKNKIIAILMASIVAMAVGVPMAMGEGATTSVAVGNVDPSIVSITITPDDDGGTAGVQINPAAGTTKTVTVVARVSDLNGHDDISTVEITSISPACSASPTPNIALSSKTPVDTTTADYEGTFDMEFYDPSATYTVTVTATDTGSLSDNTPTAAFDYTTCIELSLDAGTIGFGTVAAGSSKEVTGDTDFATATAPTIKNQGNVVIDLLISGTDMTGTEGTITVDNLADDLDTDGYDALTPTPIEHDELDLAAGASSTHGINFKLGVPSGTDPGSYGGSVTLGAKLNDA